MIFRRTRYWKLLTRRNGRLCSYALLPPRWIAFYAQGHRTTPPVAGSELFCYSSLSHARRIGNTGKALDSEIWEVKVENPRSIGSMCLGLHDPIALAAFWEGEALECQTCLCEQTIITGTTITLLRKIWSPSPGPWYRWLFGHRPAGGEDAHR